MKLQVHSLGVLLDTSLNLDAQASAATRSVFDQLKLEWQLSLYLEMSDMVIATHALLKSYLDYCSAIYTGRPLESVWKLQQVNCSWLRVSHNSLVATAPLTTSQFLGTVQSASFDL